MTRAARHRLRTTTAAALAAIVALLVVLNARPIAIAGVHGYQRTIAPFAARAGLRCRFTPSCSHYAETVIARDGLIRGGWESVKRIARCNPLTPMGTSDAP